MPPQATNNLSKRVPQELICPTQSTLPHAGGFAHLYSDSIPTNPAGQSPPPLPSHFKLNRAVDPQLIREGRLWYQMYLMLGLDFFAIFFFEFCYYEIAL